MQLAISAQLLRCLGFDDKVTCHLRKLVCESCVPLSVWLMPAAVSWRHMLVAAGQQTVCASCLGLPFWRRFRRHLWKLLGKCRDGIFPPFKTISLLLREERSFVCDSWLAPQSCLIKNFCFRKFPQINFWDDFEMADSKQNLYFVPFQVSMSKEDGGEIIQRVREEQ